MIDYNANVFGGSRMTPERVKRITRWVNALLSGEYKRGEGVLRYTNLAGEKEHCCLGVACDLEQPNSWGALKEKGDGHSLGGHTGNDSTGGGEFYLSARGLRLFGLTDNGQHTLAKINDDDATSDFQPLVNRILMDLGAKLRSQAL